MTFKYRYRKQIILGIIVFLIISSIITFTTYKLITNNNSKEDELITEKKVPKKKATTRFVEYKVDIKGEILSPGIYTVKEDTRIIDVITMAGGLTENANTSVINLSKKVVDEMVIIIYSNYEIENFKQTKELFTMKSLKKIYYSMKVKLSVLY